MGFIDAIQQWRQKNTSSLFNSHISLSGGEKDTMECTECKENLIQYSSEGTIDDNILDQIEEHIAVCDNCYNFFQMHSRLLDKLKDTGAKELIDNTADYMISLSTTYQEQGNLEEAKKYLRQALELRPGDEEIEKEISELSVRLEGEPSFIPEGLKDLVMELTVLTSGAHFSCTTCSFEPDLMRRDGLQENTYFPGERIVISVESPEKRDGFLAVFHYDEEYNLAMIFPDRPGVDTSLKAGIEKRIGIEAARPVGKHYLKAIWTAKQIIDPEKVKFEGDASAAALIKNFLTSVHTLGRERWFETVSEFEVIEK